MYFIVTDLANFTTSSSTDLIFTLDGSEAGSFLHTPSGQPTYTFNVLGYANAAIGDGKHQLTIEASGDSGSLILFDYAIYTYV